MDKSIFQISIKPKFTKILFNFYIQAQHTLSSCIGKKCGDRCEIVNWSRTGEKGNRGICNNLGNCVKAEPGCGKLKHS